MKHTKSVLTSGFVVFVALVCIQIAHGADSHHTLATPEDVPAPVLIDLTPNAATPAPLAFDDGQLTPGSSGGRCSTVRYRAALPASLRVVATELTTTQGLGHYLQLHVEQVRPDPALPCDQRSIAQVLYAGPLVDLPQTWEAAASTPMPGTGHDQVEIRLSYALSANVPPEAQRGTVGFRLMWVLMQRPDAPASGD